MRWPCSRRRWGGAWSRRRWAGPRSCWSRPIPSTIPRASYASTVGTCGAMPATSATNCPASPGTAWPARTGTGSAGCTSGWWAASGTRPWWPPSPSTRSAPAPPGRGGARPCVYTPTCWVPSRRGCWAPSRRGAPEAMHDETIAIHGGYTPDGTRAVAVPIYQTVAHDFIDAAHAGAVLDLETPGFHYNRLNNPTCDVLEQRICALEGGTGALVVASGMAA